MGNCLKCFKKSEDTTTAGTTTNSPASTIQQQNDREIIERGETDELLTPSPLHITNLKSEPLKTILQINGNVMGDILSTVKQSVQSQQTTINQVSDNTLNALFEEYKDPDEDAILSEGIEKLCCHLGYKPDDFAILVLAWRLDASQMCRFTKTEFIQGLQEMNADTVDGIKIMLEQIINNMKNDSDMFKQLYRFTFKFGLEPGHRILTLEMAIILWRLVFTLHRPEILGKWLYFLEQHPNIRGILKDTWNMFLNFAETCDITSYDDTEAWPSLFDDFVEYETDRCNQNLTKDDKNFNGL